MIGLGIGGVLNIFLDPIFIFGLDLGISGAAIATLLSQCVSASILASFFLRGQSEIRVSIRCVSTAPKTYLTIFKSGMPSFFRQGMASVSAMALNFNAGVYGDAAVAAMAIVTKVFNFLLSAVIGFGQGMQPVVGYNYGARELGRVRQAVSFSLKFCTALLTVAAVAGAVFAPQIVQFFRNDPAVVAVGTRAFRFQCVSLPLAAVLVFANMLFQSLGKSWRASLLALCRAGDVFHPAGVPAAHALWAAGAGDDADVLRPDRFSGVGGLSAPLFPAGVRQNLKTEGRARWRVASVK